MESLVLPLSIIAIVVAFWLISTKSFRKNLGKTVSVHAEAMTESAQFSRANAKLEAMQELNDNGHTKETVAKHIADFDELFKN